MPHKDQSKQEAFQMWQAGKSLSEIQDKSTAERESVKSWVRDWERGKQAVWKPSIR